MNDETNQENEGDIEATFSVDDNPEFAALLNEGAHDDSSVESDKEGANISDSKAERIARGGLDTLLALPEMMGREPFVMHDKIASLVISLSTPAVKKYEPKFKVKSEGVDLAGWVPDAMAFVATLIVGVCVLPQLGKKKEQSEEVQDSGNQPEHG